MFLTLSFFIQNILIGKVKTIVNDQLFEVVQLSRTSFVANYILGGLIINATAHGTLLYKFKLYLDS